MNIHKSGIKSKMAPHREGVEERARLCKHFFIIMIFFANEISEKHRYRDIMHHPHYKVYTISNKID